MSDDEYTMTCEHCGHTWDGCAQCQCPGNMGENIQYKEIENLAASGDLDLLKLDGIRTTMVPGSDDKKSPTYDKNFPKGYTPEQKWPTRFGSTGTYAQMVSDDDVMRFKNFGFDWFGHDGVS